VVARNLQRRLALAVALVAVLAGGTAVALGASGSSSHGRKTHRAGTHQSHSPLALAAAYLGVPETQLRHELHAGKTLAQIADATPGHSAAGLTAALVGTGKSRLQQRVTELVNQPGGPHARRGAARANRGHIRAAVLSYLGLTRKQLVHELHSGKTLAQVADATPGKSSAGLIEAVLTAAKTRLDAAVSAGTLPKQAETTRLASLRARVTALVNRPHTARLHRAKPAH
jgi:hypothetical protein